MNIKKQTKEFLKTTQEYCNNKGDCNGCFFNIDMGSDGARCRLNELNNLYN